MRMTGLKKSVLGIVCLVLLGLSSCKTARVITSTPEAKPISTGKLIRNIENNAFDYKHLSIKKISCQFDNGKTKTSFRASIFAEKDKRITIMLTKLNIPVGRLWLTPDSVKFINYLENTYFLDDYNYLSSVLDMDVDFETVHAIISNNVFSLRDVKKDRDNNQYETKIDSGFYVLESVKDLKTRKIDSKEVNRKIKRKTPKIVDNAPVHESLYIDPGTFKLRKIKMEDQANSRSLKIEFNDFTAIEKQLYPADIFLHFLSPDNNMQMKIKLGGFSMEDEKEIRFKVPEKFTRINSN
jgi:hypothetical protein